MLLSILPHILLNQWLHECSMASPPIWRLLLQIPSLAALPLLPPLLVFLPPQHWHLAALPPGVPASQRPAGQATVQQCSGSGTRFAGLRCNGACSPSM
jgi:hypothetical protein